MLTPAIYRTTITHRRQAPVRHSFEYRSYSWYVDVDHLPTLPWWLRPFARFDAADHFAGLPGDSLRQRVDAFLAEHDVAPPGGRVTALLQARVLGYVFNPISVFWCHDSDGALRQVIAEVHNTYGQRHAYLLPPASRSALVTKRFYVSRRSTRWTAITWCVHPVLKTTCTSPCHCTVTTRPRSSPRCAEPG